MKLYTFGAGGRLAFELKEGVTHVGRAQNNDICIGDNTVSRTHLSIRRSGERCYVTDLKSENGTFIDGQYLESFVETEVKKGTPIVIGMTVIGIGESSIRQVMPFVNSMGFSVGDMNQSGIFQQSEEESGQKSLELIYKTSEALGRSTPLRQTLEKVLVRTGQPLPAGT